MESNRSKEGIHQLATHCCAGCGSERMLRTLARALREVSRTPGCVVNMYTTSMYKYCCCMNLQGLFVVYVTTSNRE